VLPQRTSARAFFRLFVNVPDQELSRSRYTSTMAKLGTTGVITYFLSRLRYPQLFSLMAALLVFDLLVPDFIPFLDEILLAAGTILLGMLKNRGDDDFPREEKDVTPEVERF
jgi:hypothetical protein